MQTNKILIIALVILAAFYLFKCLAQKKNENFVNMWENSFGNPVNNDVGPRAVSAGNSYATLGSSCTSCSERPSLRGIMNS
jgi:hypothetical protein